MQQNQNSTHVPVRITVLVMCEISCVLEGEDIVDSEDLKDLSVGEIV
jgi:hypothetical protein